MQLVSADGTTVGLRPRRYQFPGITGPPRNWDANWLFVAGDVWLAEGRGWSFSAPCLTTWEARSLGAWLRGVETGAVQPSDPDDEAELESFTEPNLALSLAARSATSAVVRVHFSLESRAPWSEADLYEFFVPLDLPLEALSAAADEWDRELSAFPVR